MNEYALEKLPAGQQSAQISAKDPTIVQVDAPVQHSSTDAASEVSTVRTDQKDAEAKRKRYIRSNDELDGSTRLRKIYKAYDSDEGVEVALHVIPIVAGGPIGQGHDGCDADLATEHFSLPSASADLCHDHLIQVQDAWREPGSLVYVTPIVTAGTLQNYIARIDDMRFRVIRKWCRQILSALGYLHGRGLSHGDVRLSNVYINGETGNVLVGNFLVMAGRTLDTDALRRLLRYVAPEAVPQLVGSHCSSDVVRSPSSGKPTAPADVYAFAMCLLEMVTRALPYGTYGDTKEEMERLERDKCAGVLPPELDEIEARAGVGVGDERIGPKDSDAAREDVRAVKDLVRRCLAVRPEDRPTVSSLLADHEFLREKKEERDDRERDRKAATATAAAVAASTATAAVGQSIATQPPIISQPAAPLGHAALAEQVHSVMKVPGLPVIDVSNGVQVSVQSGQEKSANGGGNDLSKPPSPQKSAVTQNLGMHSGADVSDGQHVESTPRERSSTIQGSLSTASVATTSLQAPGQSVQSSQHAEQPHVHAQAGVSAQFPAQPFRSTVGAVDSAGPVRASHKYVVTTSSMPAASHGSNLHAEMAGQKGSAAGDVGSAASTTGPQTAAGATQPSSGLSASLSATGPRLLGLSLAGLKFGRTSLAVSLALYYSATHRRSNHSAGSPPIAYRLIRFLVDRTWDLKDASRKLACEIVAHTLAHPDDVDAISGWLVASLAGVLVSPHVFDQECLLAVPTNQPAAGSDQTEKDGQFAHRKLDSSMRTRSRQSRSRTRARTGSTSEGAYGGADDVEDASEDEDEDADDADRGADLGEEDDEDEASVDASDARSAGARSAGALSHATHGTHSVGARAGTHRSTGSGSVRAVRRASVRAEDGEHAEHGGHFASSPLALPPVTGVHLPRPGILLAGSAFGRPPAGSEASTGALNLLHDADMAHGHGARDGSSGVGGEPSYIPTTVSPPAVGLPLSPLRSVLSSALINGPAAGAGAPATATAPSRPVAQPSGFAVTTAFYTSQAKSVTAAPSTLSSGRNSLGHSRTGSREPSRERESKGEFFYMSSTGQSDKGRDRAGPGLVFAPPAVANHSGGNQNGTNGTPAASVLAASVDELFASLQPGRQ